MHRVVLASVLLCLMSVIGLQAQPTNAEKIDIEVSGIKLEVEELIEQGEELLYRDPEQSKIYFERALELATRSEDPGILAMAHQSMSIYFWARGDFQRAMESDRRALSFYQTSGDREGFAYALNGLAVSLTDLGLYHEALKHFLEAEKILTETQDSTGLQMIYLNLGVVFEKMDDFDAAMDFYKQALELSLALNLYAEVADVYNNMAEIKLMRGYDDEAYELYSMAFKIYKSENDLPGIAIIKLNLGDYYRKKKNYPVAESLFLEAAEACQKMKDFHGYCETKLLLGKLYRQTGRYSESEEYLREVIEESRKKQYLELYIEGQRQWAQLMYVQENYPEAYRSFLAYDLAKDSLQKATRSREFDNLRMAYEAEEKERQLSALQSEREKERIISQQKDRLGNALIVIASLLLIFSIAGILFYTRLQKINNKLEEQQGHLEVKNKEIREQAEKLKAANTRLINEKKLAEISSEAKAEFVSVLSHEIRTPLNAIVGISDALQDEIEESGPREYLDALTHSASNLLAFTNNILDLSRLDAGKLELNEETIELRYLINQISKTFETTIEKKGLFLIRKIDDEIPTFVRGDKMRLTQILLNIISNAVKYTSSGGISVDVNCTGWIKNGVEIEFKVMDTGQGIPEELKSKIFDRYSRLQFESTLTPQGSGLGLSITKSLVELMDGTIDFESEPGSGTTFRVSLAFRPAINSEGELTKNTTSSDQLENILAGKRMLLVEDNEVNIMFTERLLQKLGIEVEIARDGEEAIEKSSETYFDLILMDLQMPKINGIEAAKIILKKNHALRIIALTANTENSMKKQLINAGFRDMLIKPFDPKTLGQKLVNWLQINP